MRLADFLIPALAGAASYHNNAGILQYVNPLIGTYGLTPNGNGGISLQRPNASAISNSAISNRVVPEKRVTDDEKHLLILTPIALRIPSVSPPFGMTRWTPQSRENLISQCPYNDLDSYIHGFQATHQPAIWMGESGQVVLNPGIGTVNPLFQQRAHAFKKLDEVSTPYVYEVGLMAEVTEAGANLTESTFSPVPGGAQPVPSAVSEGANGRTRRDEPSVAEPTPQSSSYSWGATGSSNATIKAALTATSHVGYLRFEFPSSMRQHLSYTNANDAPYVFIQATRQNWTGHVEIDPVNREVSGSNPQRQDYALGPSRAPGFSGYFVSRFSQPFASFGTTQGGDVDAGAASGEGEHLGAYVKFSDATSRVEVRTAVSFVSVEQARRNLDIEIPDGVSFEQTVESLKLAWLDKLGRVTIAGVNQTDSNHDPRTIWYTGLFHALQWQVSGKPCDAWSPADVFACVSFASRSTLSSLRTKRPLDRILDPLRPKLKPDRCRFYFLGIIKTCPHADPMALLDPSDFSEPLSANGSVRTFYSGYTDSVHRENDSYYQSWSIWDTYRAEHSLLTLLAPERVDSMMRSLLRIFEWSGRLPMWANVVETNIMIGTHVDAVLANALTRGFNGFDIATAWAGVKKNAFVPPLNDTDLLYYDREGYTPDEVRAGLTEYMRIGYVPNDQWAESASRTLDYAFDDFAASVVAEHAGDHANAQLMLERSQNYRTVYNNATSFMEAKNANGTWAGSEQGWTEGDDWVYLFNVMHDPDGLAALVGGQAQLKAKLDEHFDGGHNDHTNEPSHHVPYLYAAIGYPASTQKLTRAIAGEYYNATSAGLAGNEDLGQMSAWYVFSALGFYPVNPASTDYVVGAPFFEKITIRLPAGAASGGVGGVEHELVISAPGAPTMPFVKGLTVDGAQVKRPVLTHQQIVTASLIEFEMADTPQDWGT